VAAAAETAAVAPAPAPVAQPPAPRDEPPPRILARTRTPQGDTVVRVIDSRGRLLELSMSKGGGIARARDAGTVLGMAVVSERRDGRGGWVRTARDHSGALVRYTLDPDGTAGNVQVIEAARGSGRPLPTARN
jgi:hypothetical protein